MDKLTFINLLTSHYCKLHSYVLCMVPNKSDAEDVMQEATLQMWEKFDEFQPGTDFFAWAKAIARYKVLDLRKKHARLHCQLDPNVLELLQHERESYDDNLDRKLELLKNCIKKLSGDQKVLLQFKYSEKLPAKLIAGRIGIPLHTLYRQITNLHSVLLGCVKRAVHSEGAIQ
jgi:RNA polymerase sigma-70 factor (ECF subfamily)